MLAIALKDEILLNKYFVKSELENEIIKSKMLKMRFWKQIYENEKNIYLREKYILERCVQEKERSVLKYFIFLYFI